MDYFLHLIFQLKYSGFMDPALWCKYLKPQQISVHKGKMVLLGEKVLNFCAAQHSSLKFKQT